MKHLKTKLVSAIAMLAVAAIMMTSATYAWFAISTAPEIANVSSSITANGALEIALGDGTIAASTTADSGKNNTWGNLIDLAAIFKTTDNKNAITLKPVAPAFASGALTFTYPKYALDGRINEMVSLVRKSSAIANTAATKFVQTDGVYFFTSTEGAANTYRTEDAANVYAFEIDFNMRTNVVGSDNTNHITLVNGITTDRGDGSSQVGSGSYVTDNSVTVYLTDGEKLWNAKETASNGIYTLALKEIDTTTFAEVSSGQDYIALSKNEAKVIKMYVFMNGANLTNDNVKTVVSDFVMNIQFQSGVALDAMDVTEKQVNGRTDVVTGS